MKTIKNILENYKFNELNINLSLIDQFNKILNIYPHLKEKRIIERILIPERVICFSVNWYNQSEEIEINRGYRVQHNSALGIYKGGIRFHPDVNLSTLKALAFEQTLKNALTGLPMGGAKGGADFDPKGRSEEDIMRFCQAFIRELHPFIGEDIDIPAGDIGVGSREIGYMYGYYRKLTNKVSAAFTGKGLSYGGSLVRKEATGFGLIYFVEEALKTLHNSDLKDKKIIVSGSGNVARYAAVKAKELGGLVIAMSDSKGYIYNPKGIDIDVIHKIKEEDRLSLEEYIKYDKEANYYLDPKNMWDVQCDIALPCATQNEIDIDEVNKLINNGVKVVAEGANMPISNEGIELLMKNNIIYCPGKAANAGGVLVSGIEIAQNKQFLSYSYEKIDNILKEKMKEIFHNVLKTSMEYGKENDLLFGANALAFLRVAKAMYEQGVY